LVPEIGTAARIRDSGKRSGFRPGKTTSAHAAITEPPSTITSRFSAEGTVVRCALECLVAVPDAGSITEAAARPHIREPGDGRSGHRGETAVESAAADLGVAAGLEARWSRRPR
jgi:hypothetical protein